MLFRDCCPAKVKRKSHRRMWRDGGRSTSANMAGGNHIPKCRCGGPIKNCSALRLVSMARLMRNCLDTVSLSPGFLTAGSLSTEYGCTTEACSADILLSSLLQTDVFAETGYILGVVHRTDPDMDQGIRALGSGVMQSGNEVDRTRNKREQSGGKSIIRSLSGNSRRPCESAMAQRATATHRRVTRFLSRQ